MARSARIFIVGETPLVEEYASLCVSKGFPVFIKSNTAGASFPRGVRKSARVPTSVTFALELTNTSADLKRKNLRLLDRSTSAGTPIISSSVTVTVAEQSSWINKPGRLLGIGALPSLLEGQLIELARSQSTSEQAIDNVRKFISSLGKDAIVVADSIGMVMPRILCMLANEAWFAMMEAVAGSDDIDTAMKLGTNYPAGPVEWARRIGLRQVFAVLSALHSHFGEDRYRVAPNLRLEALP